MLLSHLAVASNAVCAPGRALRFAEQCGKNTQELESELEERQGELTQQEKQQLLAQKAEWKELADSSFKLGVQRLAIIYTPLQNTLRMVFNENHLTVSGQHCIALQQC
jgi:hypothetical protein